MVPSQSQLFSKYSCCHTKTSGLHGKCCDYNIIRMWPDLDGKISLEIHQKEQLVLLAINTIYERFLLKFKGIFNNFRQNCWMHPIWETNL